MSQLMIGALQLPTLGMNATRLEFYLKKAHERGARLILFPEYVLNHFYRDLEKISPNMVKEQTKLHIKALKEFAKQYDMTFIAPIVLIKGKKQYKTIAKITAKSTSFYHQQILIPYKHWNEKAFFDNEIAPLKEPMIFKQDGYRVAVMAGFELHFDYFWDIVRKKRVDLVLLPSAATFGSHERWMELIKSRAFIYGCYILRANRLGEYVDDDIKWRFYGNTMLVNPSGEVEMMLEDKESMLIEDIDREHVKEHRRSWRFMQEIELRERLQ